MVASARPVNIHEGLFASTHAQRATTVFLLNGDTQSLLLVELSLRGKSWLDFWFRPLDIQSPPRIAYMTRLWLGAPHRIEPRSRLPLLDQHRTTESGHLGNGVGPWVAQRECCPAARRRQRSDAPGGAQPRSRVLSNPQVH